ncbi:MAG: hypothetical protein Q8908_06185 [Bacteroidota bacterium]|nr:hypothetical protein [Bacteroidota bacterium]
MTRKLVLFIVLFNISIKAMSQIAFMAGPNYCFVRSHDLLQNQNPVFAYHTGFSLKLYPFKKAPAYAIQTEIMIDQKGYQQKLDINYLFHFNYNTWNVLFNYDRTKNLSVNAGLAFSWLRYTSMQDGMSTYNHNDIGLVLGICCLESHRVNVYARAVYGLAPMLDYYKIDKLGNFTGQIHDLKNMCFSAGIKINLRNEKLHLYK